MLTHSPSSEKRAIKTETIACDLVVGGGGLAGVCAAITAARSGLKVTLVQDRPVLGGNASSEVRLWILGATSHMGNNNRWARESGVIGEIMTENLHRNREGNPILVDALVLEMVAREPNITLLLNTAIHDLEKSDADTIRSVRAFNSQNSTEYHISAPLFCDASGDGIIGFLAGAAFRMGAEKADEFDERMAPGGEYGELLGHTLYFYSRDTGKPVKYVPPSFALTDITKIPRHRNFSVAEHGCKLWWVEFGGRMDTVHETEKIKWELWKVIYGVWNHIKNSGNFPEAETMTLEWVGMIPGKRESRRFEGDTMLNQRDVIGQIPHTDDVSFGGWAIDLHPADGVYSPKDGCMQYHSKGVYGIPYRTMYSRNIKNLFLAGRIISSSHVAYGSTRVMGTCSHSAQAVGIAAALCKKYGALPRDFSSGEKLSELQRELLKRGQYIPGVALKDSHDLARSAKISATSELVISQLAPSGRFRRLDASWAMMIPVTPGHAPKVTYQVRTSVATTLRVELRISAKPQNHTPDTTLATREITLKPGEQPLDLDFATATISQAQYAFYIVHANPLVEAAISDQRVTGILALTHFANKAVAKAPVQTPEPGCGVESFEFWPAQRRPKGENLAFTVEPPIAFHSVANLTNGFARPVSAPNAWAASFADHSPAVTLAWDKPQTIRRVVLSLDADFDHPMESVQMGHPENDMPFCVSKYKILDANTGRILVEVAGNHHDHREHVLSETITTTALRIEVAHPEPNIPAAIFAVRAYAE